MMTKTIWTGVFSSIIVGAAITAMAQAPAAQQNTSPSADQMVTVTGCLRPAPLAGSDAAATAGTTGTAAAATTETTGATGSATPADSADAKFILTEATVSAAKAETGSAPGTPGTTAGTSSGGAPQTFQLIANGAALRPHVGKKVALTGTLVNQTASTSTASATATAGGPALRVESGKVFTTSCQ
jgi:hypothetical protein